MFPFQPFQLHSFGLQHTSSQETVPAPISDIESETNSVNGDLCQSFEGLFSKEREESTMSSAWSNILKDSAAASQLENFTQNQVGQKSHKKKEFPQENSVKKSAFAKIYQKLKEKKAKKVDPVPTEEDTLDKIQLQTSETVKLCHENRNKIQKYRQLLRSQACYTKLPHEFLELIEMSYKLDSYLSTKKDSIFTENLYNLFRVLFCDEEMSSIWSNVKKIMFIAPEHYCLRIDPLKNLCLSFAQKNDTKVEIRKQKLRKIMGEYYFSNKKLYDEEGIPQAYVQPMKTTRFYPENLNLCPEIHKKVSKRYLNKLEQNVLLKQTKLELVEQNSHCQADASPEANKLQCLPSLEQLENFCSAVSVIYSEKKVTHLYKTSLIENLRKNTVFSLQRIFFIIKYITETELFLEVVVKGQCKIFRLRDKERQDLLNQLKAKIQTKSTSN